MATSFKTFLNNDKTSTRTLLHESIPITGSIVSGTYADNNIKSYSHGMFQSTYDYPYLSSSANHIFDIAVGYATGSKLASTDNTQNSKKINIYQQMAQVLVGHDTNGNIQPFDKDGDIAAGGTKSLETFFLNFSRLLQKDEIKKGSFELELGVKGTYNQAGTTFGKRIKITDTSGSNGYFTASPAGEYGLLFASSSTGTTPLIKSGDCTEDLTDSETNPPCGLLYYQAGVAVISGSVFTSNADEGILLTDGIAATYADALTIAGHSDNDKFYVNVPAAIGGAAANITIKMVSGTPSTGTANQVEVSTAGTAAEILARFIIAIAGGTPSPSNSVAYGAGSGDATDGVAGITAVEGSTNAVTITATTGGSQGNDTLFVNVVGSLVTSGVGTLNLAGGTGNPSMGKTTAATGFNFITGSSINTIADSIRNRIYNVQFNNTTELNSTIYFCRINHNDFNYSSNPTYTNNSKIRVKNNTTDSPIAYITTVGLYSADNELLAVAKLSEPLKKDPTNEMTIRVRLDY